MLQTIAHRIKKEEVVFHETGAMDSIIDVISFAYCLDNLQIDKVYAFNLREGKGSINTRVGPLPIPTPAVANIVKKFALTIKEAFLPYELITPTGLACLCATAKFCKPSLNNIQKVGYGVGKREYKETTGLLKVYLL